MTTNLSSTDKLTKLIDDFFKEFRNESLIWVGDIWNFRRKTPSGKYLDFLNKHHNFESIVHFLKKDFSNYDQDELEDYFKECYETRIRYIPNEDLSYLKDQDRVCWFIINKIQYTYREIKEKNYKYSNPYFSLIFLLHVEFNSGRITLNNIREYFEILNKEKNPLDILSNYINDADFIDWALKYTNKKYRIRTKPDFSPKDNSDKKYIFLAYWDYQFSIDKYKYEVEINALKKAWQQKQFRDKGGLKKPYHLPLTKNTKSQLGALADMMNISEAKVLEKLIGDAYKNEMLDEKGKARY
ncbi:hypothetical protein [Acinetobacter faecalis]|uniref:hypothetical protein n=1 Tax=Acinetobacter faecalis TaxID=2665161 RepID=UPI002A913B89|nr:hypothetical protein [Acinetobacter faecalis]MDY6456792.1 hypothetical protein [Acinetobacter faecalis]